MTDQASRGGAVTMPDFDQVCAWCEAHDWYPPEAWLCMLIDGSLSVAELRAAILENRDARMRDDIAVCEICGEGTDDQGTCGPCVNCKMPLCIHHADAGGSGVDCPLLPGADVRGIERVKSAKAVFPFADRTSSKPREPLIVRIPPLRTEIGDETERLVAEMEALPEYRGWRFTYEYPGYFCYSHPDNDFFVFFTPDWEGDETLPIQIQTADGDHYTGLDPQSPLPLPREGRTAQKIFELVRPTLDKLLVATVKDREPIETPRPKHPFGCPCNDCEHFRAEHGS